MLVGAFELCRFSFENASFRVLESWTNRRMDTGTLLPTRRAHYWADSGEKMDTNKHQQLNGRT